MAPPAKSVLLASIDAYDAAQNAQDGLYRIYVRDAARLQAHLHLLASVFKRIRAELGKSSSSNNNKDASVKETRHRLRVLARGLTNLAAGSGGGGGGGPPVNTRDGSRAASILEIGFLSAKSKEIVASAVALRVLTRQKMVAELRRRNVRVDDPSVEFGVEAAKLWDELSGKAEQLTVYAERKLVRLRRDLERVDSMFEMLGVETEMGSYYPSIKKFDVSGSVDALAADDTLARMEEMFSEFDGASSCHH